MACTFIYLKKKTTIIWKLGGVAPYAPLRACNKMLKNNVNVLQDYDTERTRFFFREI